MYNRLKENFNIVRKKPYRKKCAIIESEKSKTDRKKMEGFVMKGINNLDSIRIKNVDDIDYVAAIRRMAGKELSKKDKEECKRFDQLCDEIAITIRKTNDPKEGLHHNERRPSFSKDDRFLLPGGTDRIMQYSLPHCSDRFFVQQKLLQCVFCTGDLATAVCGQLFYTAF